jgi:hypothetical protein
MKRFVLNITEENHEQLRRLSFEKRVSIAKIVRNAIGQYLICESVPTPVAKLKR